MPAKQELIIEKVIFGGSGLGRLEGKVCLVNDVIEGETVQVRIRQDKKGFSRGKLVRIDRPSVKRVVPPCIYVKQCGGCQYQHMDYNEQLRVKEEQVREAVTHSLKLPASLVETIRSSPQPFHYRNHVTLHPIDPDFDEPQRLGYVGRDNNTITPVDECVIADKRLMPIFQTQIALQPDQKRISFWISESGEIISDLYPATFKVRLFGRSVQTHAQGFFQNNPGVIELILDEVRELVEQKRPSSFIDLYAGVGIFSIFSAAGIKRRVFIEENHHSVDQIRRNLTEKEADGAEILHGKVERLFPVYWDTHREEKGFVFLDPPRTGLEPVLPEYLSVQTDIDTLVYLACDLQILVRDLKKILSRGHYQVERIIPFDMFPQTKHIEVLAVLVAG